MIRKAAGTEGPYTSHPVTDEEHRALFPNRRYTVVDRKNRATTPSRETATDVARELSLYEGREIRIEVFDDGDLVGTFFYRDGLMRNTIGDFR